MVGGVRSALILLAACAPATEPAHPQANALAAAIGNVAWPAALLLPELPASPDIDASMASMVIAKFGPPRGAALRSDAEQKLRLQVPTLKGTARLVALDHLAETADIDSDEAFDGDAMVVKLEHAAAEYTSLIAEPGFTTYANADQVLYRAARVQFEVNDFDAGALLVDRMLADYPRSPWIADVYVLIAAADVDRDAAAARRYFDDAIAIAPAALSNYARFERLYALDRLGEFRTELTDAEQLARSDDTYREPATLAILHAFAEAGEPSEAPTLFGTMDRAHLPTLLRRVSDAYVRSSRLDAAATVLTDVLAGSQDSIELCAAHARLFELELAAGDHAAVLREGHAFADQAMRTIEAQCHHLVDDKLGAAAWGGSLETGDRASPLDNLRDADAMWQLALAVVSTPERKAVELRDRAYVTWRLAIERHDHEGWMIAAAAFDAAFAATHDARLDAGASLARSNAHVLAYHH